jgi:hypothetical protein
MFEFDRTSAGTENSGVDIRAIVRQGPDGRWSAATDDRMEVRAQGDTRDQCVRALRDAVASSWNGRAEPLTLVVEVRPRLAGVAEAAAIIGWDKRRVITYIDRGRFPEPIQSLAAGRVWLWDDVERYAREWHARNEARRLRRAGGDPPA